MAKIKQLPESVANQISAGEVVERPSSVIKELVENSVDAGSSNIIIEVDNGGKDRIRVKDNGSGISNDEIELAFSRYATSKIEEINDLYSIRTLGFRGEALASIASVSRIKMSSKLKEANRGTLIKLEGGELVKKEPAGVPSGTDIIVRDLFYNTPARFKYMKTTSTEFGHISNVIYREALAYPEIQFKLYHNKKVVLKTPGTGQLLDTIYAIYGQELVDQLLPIDFEDRYIRLNGYIANPNYNRKSRIHELFFVNRRNVYNNVLHQGVEEGYRGLLPPRSYPVVFLFLKLNQILVDVNVHPTKREIKFSRNQIIKEVIRKGVRAALKENDSSPRMKLTEKEKSTQPSKQRLFREVNIKKSNIRVDSKNRGNKVDVENIKNMDLDNTATENNYFDIDPDTNEISEGLHKDPNSTSENKSSDDNKKSKVDSAFVRVNEKSQSYPEIPVKKIMGQIHNTYIVVEGIDGLYIIDQHNAHERIRYHAYLKKYDKNRVISQSLLVPITIELTLPEMEIINKYRDQLIKLGIKLESFGNKSLLLQEVPLIMKKRSSKEVIRELIDNLIKKGKTMNQAEIINEIITYMSCRGAVKAGMYLNRDELENLVYKLFKTDNPYRCPHGRPIIIHLTEADIEKGMGRK